MCKEIEKKELIKKKGELHYYNMKYETQSYFNLTNKKNNIK